MICTGGYKTYFVLNNTEHEISIIALKTKLPNQIMTCFYRQMKMYFDLSISDVVFIMLINVKILKIVGILAFMSRMNFVFS